MHHAIFRTLEPIFDKSFIFDSYSSRKEKGTHKAIERFKEFAWKLSRNNTRPVWILKCDVKKFFDSVDHQILLSIISRKIEDPKTIGLLSKIITSFKKHEGKGIPLGNLTSQLFSNVYLDILDQYVKRTLGAKYYIRYADDFVLMHTDKEFLEKCLADIRIFLEKELKLSLHANKVLIRKFSQGVDFLGYVLFPHHQVLRTKTKNRTLKKVEILKKKLDQKVITKDSFEQALQSHLGLLTHCRGRKVRREVIDLAGVQSDWHPQSK